MKRKKMIELFSYYCISLKHWRSLDGHMERCKQNIWICWKKAQATTTDKYWDCIIWFIFYIYRRCSLATLKLRHVSLMCVCLWWQIYIDERTFFVFWRRAYLIRFLFWVERFYLISFIWKKVFNEFNHAFAIIDQKLESSQTSS